MSAVFVDANAVFWALTAAALVVNAVPLALPARSLSSIAVGFASAVVTFVVADLIGSFLFLLPAVVVAVLAAREWSYRWCLVSLPAVAIAYFLFEVLRPLHWPLLLLTLCAYAIPVAHQIRRRRAHPL